MASSYSHPVNTDKKLYLEMQYEEHSFGTLFDRIRDHFGPEVKLNQFHIEIDNLQVAGCGCCYDSNDWSRFLTITLQDEPSVYTSALPLSALIAED